jgi:hypothetical protein
VTQRHLAKASLPPSSESDLQTKIFASSPAAALLALVVVEAHRRRLCAQLPLF